MIDALGRVTQSQHYLPAFQATALPFSYQYNLGGMMTSVTYPSGRVVEYTANAANRVNSVKRSATENYLASAQYTAAGALQSAVMGASAFTQTWGFNGRHQVKSLQAQKGATLLLGLTNTYTPTQDGNYGEVGNQNNGNLYFQRMQYTAGGLDYHAGQWLHLRQRQPDCDLHGYGR